MKPLLRIFFLLLSFRFLGTPPVLTEPTPVPGTWLPASQWEDVYARFEGAFLLQTSRLESLQREMEKNQHETKGLDSQIVTIRQNKDPGVFDQFRLNHLLNDLKDHLEKNSSLQRQWADSQKEHEQKGLSLIALLNDRIEGLLEQPSTAPGMSAPILTTLSVLAQKRRQVQETLDRFQPRKEKSQSPPLSAFQALGTDDPESLQMTMDLLQEREKALEEEDQKLSLEAGGIQDEMKLQKKMKDFLAGIKRMNQDSGAPPEGFDRGDLSRLYGGKNPEKLSARLLEVQTAQARNQSAREQIKKLMIKIQDRQNSFKERKKR